MKHHLNTLFVTTQEAYLAKEGEAVLVRVEKQTKLRVPVHNLGGIVCFGRVGVSPSLMGLCGERGVAITMLSTTGQFRARINGFTPGNVLLRKEQYRRSDSAEASAKIARWIVAAKVANGRSVLLRAVRDYPDHPGRPALEAAAARMALGVEDLQREPGDPKLALSLDAVRGLEGEAANAYFGCFDHLIVAQKGQADGKADGKARRTASRSPAATAGRPWTRSTRCCRSCTRCSGTTPGPRARRPGWTRRSGSCTATAPAGRGWRWT